MEWQADLRRRYWSVLTIRKDTTLLAQLFDHYQASAEKELAHVEGASFQMASNPLTSSFLRKNQDAPTAIRDYGDGLFCE
jgi:hypothetical protein